MTGTCSAGDFSEGLPVFEGRVINSAWGKAVIARGVDVPRHREEIPWGPQGDRSSMADLIGEDSLQVG